MYSALRQNNRTFGRRIQRLSLPRLLYCSRWCEQLRQQSADPRSNARHSPHCTRPRGDWQYERRFRCEH